VQVGFVSDRPRVPGDGDRAVRIAGVGDVVALVGAGRGRCARGGGVGEDVRAEGGEGAGDWGGVGWLDWDAEVHWDRREEGLLGKGKVGGVFKAWLNVGYARTYLVYLCYRIQQYRFVCRPSPLPLLCACLQHHSGAAFAIRKGWGSA
jgi:hypothetical protein